MDDEGLNNEHVTMPLQSKTQLEINEIVISTAKEVYGKINQNWKYLDNADQLSTTSTMWELTWINGHEPTLVLKSPIKELPNALDDLINKPASLECSIALKTTMISCLRKILKDDAFMVYATIVYENLQSDPERKVENFFHDLAMDFVRK